MSIAETDAVDKINMKYGKTLEHLARVDATTGWLGYAGGKISYTRIPSVEDFW